MSELDKERDVDTARKQGWARWRALPPRQAAVEASTRIVHAADGVWRRATATARQLPDFMIIGAQKAGTTTLQATLVDHPQVSRTSRKEVHWFDLQWHQSEAWYRSHFPVRWSPTDERAIAGDASPYYLYHPRAPARAKDVVPNARLIVLLRDPAARAYSHYHHEVRAGRESLDFDAAIDAEPERLRGETERLMREDDAYSFEHQRHSYVDRGRYAQQLARWFRFFARDQILVLEAETLFEQPRQTMARVTEFLGIADWDPGVPPRANAGQYDALTEAQRARLAALYAEPNAELEALVGRRFRWSGTPRSEP